MLILPATPDDAPALAALVNRAYRGATAERGWSHEAQLIAGQRTDAAMVRAQILAAPGTVLLARADGDATPVGCVAIEPLSPAGRWTLGLLTVDPDRQAGGLGARLMAAAEAYATAHGARVMEMTVIEGRASLIAWYGRRGYGATGSTKPFPYGDTRFGHPLRDDLRFIVLEKPLAG